VQGLASEVVVAHELAHCRTLMHRARGGAPGGSHFTRIATTRLTGRRFAAA
jgi:hypothetical protein